MMSLETERLAWVLLRTAHRTRARGSTARLVVPRNPETVDELGRGLAPTPTDDDLLTAEEYLEEHGYLQATRPGTAPLFAPREMPPTLPGGCSRRGSSPTSCTPRSRCSTSPCCRSSWTPSAGRSLPNPSLWASRRSR